MLFSKHSLVLPLFLIAAASPVASAAKKAFENRNELKAAVDTYCANPALYDTSMYGPIEDWDVSEVTTMSTLFYYQTSCNPNIGSWDVSKCNNFQNMFNRADVFNQDISAWDVSGTTDFHAMFYNAFAFNQDISSWDVSGGTDFFRMFSDSAFNQDISNWAVSSGTHHNVNFGMMFYNAKDFDQPSIYCNWQSNIFFANNYFTCEGTTISCGWGLTECPTTVPPTPFPTHAPTATPTSVASVTPTPDPTPGPTPAPTSAPTFSLPKERSWYMAFLTNIAVANVADSLDAEISQSFNISNRAFEVKYYKNDCKSELAHSISEQNNVRSSDEGGNAGFLKLETTAILNSTEVFYEGDRDDIFTGNITGGYASLCIRADLYLSDNKDISMQFLEKRVNVTVDLETASLSVGDDIDMDRTDAVDNADVGLDYSNYVEAYECDPSNVSDKSYTGTYEQGSVLNICVKSTNPEVIDIETITNMLVEQDVVDSVIGEKYQYIADGEYNSEIANLDCNTYTNPKVCIGELSLISKFFEELNPPSLKVSGDVIFAANPSSGGDSTRLLRAMALLPLKSSAGEQKNGRANIRALNEDDTKTNDSDEVGSFRNVEVGGLISSKMSRGAAVTSKADKSAFTMSSLAFDIVVGGATLLLLV